MKNLLLNSHYSNIVGVFPVGTIIELNTPFAQSFNFFPVLKNVLIKISTTIHDWPETLIGDTPNQDVYACSLYNYYNLIFDWYFVGTINPFPRSIFQCRFPLHLIERNTAVLSTQRTGVTTEIVTQDAIVKLKQAEDYYPTQPVQTYCQQISIEIPKITFPAGILLSQLEESGIRYAFQLKIESRTGSMSNYYHKSPGTMSYIFAEVD